jgi:hypothetical protein
MVANLFLTKTALAPVPAPMDTPTLAPLPTISIPTVVTPTASLAYFTPYLTPTPSFTPSVTGTVFTPTVNPNTLAFGCNNLAFVADKTYPAGSVLAPGAPFTKTWKVANIGTCDWMYQYSFMLVGGAAMSGKTFKLNTVMIANHWHDLSVGLTAPRDAGKYTAYWRMADADGHPFGATLVISIVVNANPTQAPTSTPEPATQTPTPTTAVADTATPSPTPTSTPTDTPEPTATPTP